MSIAASTPAAPNPVARALWRRWSAVVRRVLVPQAAPSVALRAGQERPAPTMVHFLSLGGPANLR